MAWAVTTSRSWAPWAVALTGARHSVRAGLAAGNRGGHVGDQGVRTAVDGRDQLAADRAGVGLIDVLGQCRHRLPARPLNGAGILRHTGTRAAGHGRGGRERCAGASPG